MDEAFYGTLPQDTQDFTQILRGVKRNLTDAARGVSYYPYDLIGAPVDIINMALTPVGLGSQQPVLGSDYLRNIAKSLGLAQDPTGSVAETTARIGAGFINPAAGARAVGQIPQQVTRGANITADKLVQMITRNPEATAPQVLQETSMPFLNAVAPKAPSLLQPQKSDLGFYSQLEDATIPLQNKGTGEQYLAQISKAPGVKPEELQWTGLDEFLKKRQSVTKAEIQDYLNANRVDLKEFRLAGDGGQSPVFAEYFPDTQKFHVFSNDLRLQGLYDTAEEADAFVRQYNANIPYGPAKFSKYTLPGGENYREILLTLPAKEERVFPTIEEWHDKTHVRPFSEVQQNPRLLEIAQRQYERDKSVFARNPNVYYSSHFQGQPNILAHMRANDRVVDGKNTLFIEEIQSDWHQAGRKKGYGPQTETTHEAYYMTPDGQKVSLGFGKTQEEAAAAVDPGWQGVVDIKFDTQTKKVGEGVPDAPFKTSWHELALKRAIQEASEKGYDQIAFTTGKTQAERYDLSKQVDSLLYSKNPDGTYKVSAQVQGRGQMMGEAIPETNLADYVGKEIAEKMVKGVGKQTEVQGRPIPGQWNTPKEYMTELSGEGLKVGGEGMKGFYDNILPKSLDKLGKKFGAKVGKTDMDGVEVWTMPITPEMRQSVTTKGQPLFAIPAIGAGLLGAGMMQEEQY